MSHTAETGLQPVDCKSPRFVVSSMAPKWHSLWIPGRLPGLNEIIASSKAHPQAYAKLKRTCSAKVVLAARVARVPCMRAVHMHYVHKEKNRRRDPSNFCSGAQKIIEDGLIRAGVLAGDGWKNVIGFEHHWHLDVNNPGVQVFICEVSPGQEAPAAPKGSDGQAN